MSFGKTRRRSRRRSLGFDDFLAERPPVKREALRQCRRREPHRILEYLEELLQFHHELPIGLQQVIPEVILAGVYTLPAYL